ncbi:Cytochrome P450 monooxygenase apf7 [Lachnellula suecica]|uniref:Cytochrome P450 monooxygenase apf7 n=1 Tax=Lachnellula suecica TaxID=602035 RepID=A0A8T9C922_9HELO|nr:Cytochrome P450 monooxygenase apf7 [Lachnellula suecica]
MMYHTALPALPSSARHYMYSLLLLVIASYFAVAFYRVRFHPLARYPGPFWAKISGFRAVYHAFIGDLHLDMLECHRHYAYRAFETTPTAHDLQSTVDTTAHTRKRRVMSQAFSDSALKTLEEHIHQHLAVFIKCLAEGSSNCDDEKSSWTVPKNVAHWCNYLSFDFMAELVFGKSFQMQEKIDNRYIIDLIQPAVFRVGVFLQMPELAVWNVDKIFLPNVRSLRDKFVALSRSMALDRVNMDSKRQDLFSHILAARDPETGNGFSLDELWGESTLLIVAGSDAISIAMSGCFFYLSRHKEAYKRALDEVRSAFSLPENIRSGPTLNSCVFLRACIEESLRMSPPVGGALWREVEAGGGYIGKELVPKGCDVGVGIYAIQHDEKYFPDPFTYSPERWLVSKENPAEAIGKLRSAFSAFSIGPVGCLGKNLAYMELTVTLARVLWSLDFRISSSKSASDAQESYLLRYPEHSKNEYHLRDRFTSWKDGPMLEFRRRHES